jgi:hypothetical protein
MNDFLKFIIKRLIANPITLFIKTLVLYGAVMLMPKEARKVDFPANNISFGFFRRYLGHKV